MGKYKNEDINFELTILRNDLRNGNAVIRYKEGGAVTFRETVASYVGVDPDAFNTENFNPQTLKRFAALFDVPSYPVTAPTAEYAFSWPTQDQTAKAIQNFINRRSRPWEFLTGKLVVTATSADPIAQAIEDNDATEYGVLSHG